MVQRMVDVEVFSTNSVSVVGTGAGEGGVFVVVDGVVVDDRHSGETSTYTTWVRVTTDALTMVDFKVV